MRVLGADGREVHLASRPRLFLRTRLRQPQDDVAIALARAAHLPEPVGKLWVEPDSNQAVGTRARRRIGRHPCPDRGSGGRNFGPVRRPGRSKLVLRLYDSAFLQPVAHHVSLIPEINPRREGAAESRFQFGTSADPDARGAATIFCRGHSVPAKVVSEIDR